MFTYQMKTMGVDPQGMRETAPKLDKFGLFLLFSASFGSFIPVNVGPGSTQVLMTTYWLDY